jgi:hypothetical protein
VRKKVGDKVKGAAQFFITDNSELGITKNTAKGSKQDSAEDSAKDSKQSNNNDTTQDTTQYTNKYTVEMPDKTELVCERLVANVTKTQKKYVKDTAKKFENESAFVRFMLDYFIQNIEIK